MKWIPLVIFSTITMVLMSIPQLYPKMGKLVDKSLQGEKAFNRQRQKCEAIWAKVSNTNDYDHLSKADKYTYDHCDETFADYWDILGIGCSWYCGGGMDTLSASSHLKPQKDISYEAKNAHDLSYKTAWIEGANGFGIGETLTYHFPPENPRITKIIIVNGYVKSEKVWKENSRVKKLKMYLNNIPFAILNLEDSRHEQEFEFEPIGESNRQQWEELKTKPWWTLKFEILDVYKGEKYDDTAISEIYFDGIDVH